MRRTPWLPQPAAENLHDGASRGGEEAGQMSVAEFGGSVNDLLNRLGTWTGRPEHDDGPTIRVLLTTTRDAVAVGYALRGFNTPIAISTLTTTARYPKRPRCPAVGGGPYRRRPPGPHPSSVIAAVRCSSEIVGTSGEPQRPGRRSGSDRRADPRLTHVGLVIARSGPSRGHDGEPPGQRDPVGASVTRWRRCGGRRGHRAGWQDGPR